MANVALRKWLVEGIFEGEPEIGFSFIVTAANIKGANLDAEQQLKKFHYLYEIWSLSLLEDE